MRVADITGALSRAGLLVAITGTLPETVMAVTDDSRAVTAGALFAAVRGTTGDGHDYLAAAATAGATAAIVEDAARTPLPSIIVGDGRRAAAVAAAAFYGEPARGIRLIAVTGTNGKTTTVGMLRHLLDQTGARSASIGTLGTLLGSAGEPLAASAASLTTPGPVEVQRTLRALADAGVRTVAMEVSSHSLHQHRVEGVHFAAAVFTNFTRDHLDYHGTMEAYFAAKAALVSQLADGGVAVVNADDRAWDALPHAPRRVTFGMGRGADVRATSVGFTPAGSEWMLVTEDASHAVQLPLIGDFNVANALGAAAAAHAVGMDPAAIAGRLTTQPQVPGRLEIIGRHPMVLRDYAHTPDALERALTALRPFTAGALIVVFGAGGDRDRGKRPLMAEVASRLADRVIITSDNPRTEDPERILDDIAAALQRGRYERIEDRRAAIAQAIVIADPARDVVLLAGKGHEDYQVRGTTKLPFDEKEIVSRFLPAGRTGANAR
ncbi:MAG: UDP-N-acetylmuramoyl-L-alanyl-D-glutamate--2,6-diaminopimelate ligase [Gemmatimonadaceae bacterium]